MSGAYAASVVAHIEPGCAVDRCSRPPVARGYCTKHYRRWLKHGDPLTNLAPKDLSPTRRFWIYVQKEVSPEDCWLWTGGISTHGYGKFFIEGRTLGAHRVAYELLIGPIPPGKELDHLCRIRACVNPAHLEPVTRYENQMRGLTLAATNARKDWCPQGHPYDEKNTRIYRGRRHCRACGRQHVRDRRQRRKAAAAA